MTHILLKNNLNNNNSFYHINDHFINSKPYCRTSLNKALSLVTMNKRFYPKGDKKLIKQIVEIGKPPIPPSASTPSTPQSSTVVLASKKPSLPEKDNNKTNVTTISTVNKIAKDGQKAWNNDTPPSEEPNTTVTPKPSADTTEKVIIEINKIKLIIMDKALTEALEKNDLYLLQPYLKEYKDLLLKASETNDLTPQEENLLNKITVFKVTHFPKIENMPIIISREIEEAIRLNTKGDLADFLQQEISSRCFTPEQYKKEMARNQKGLDILEKYSEELTEPELIEIFRRSGIIKNPDALYKNTANQNIIIKEGEGPKVVSKVYNIMQKHSLFSNEGIKPNVEKILESNNSGTFMGGTVEREHASNTLILSGIDLHFVVIIEDPDNKDYYLIEAMLTSSKDKDTIMLSRDQPINKDLNENQKPQMIRFLTHLVRIHKSHFNENATVTAYLKGYNKDGENIHDKITNGITKAAESFKDNSIENPRNLTKKELIILAKIFYQENINDLKTLYDKVENELINVTDEMKYKIIDKLKKQENNYLKEKKEKEYYKNLSSSNKFIQDIYILLKAKKKKYKDTIDKKDKEAHIAEMKTKALNLEQAINQKIIDDKTNETT